MRLAVKLTRLRPTLNSISNPNTEQRHGFVLLTDKDLGELFRALEDLLKEAEVLSPDEQDKISQVVANFELMLPAINANELPEEGAKYMVELINKAIDTIEKHGMMHGQPYQPWQKKLEHQ